MGADQPGPVLGDPLAPSGWFSTSPDQADPGEPRDPEQATRLEEVRRLAERIRAPIIEQAIGIDELISDILARHFCDDADRYRLFQSLFLSGGEISFSAKVSILRDLLRLRYGSLYRQHQKALDELERVRRARNDLAHSLLDTSPATLDKGASDRIQLRYYEDGRDKQRVMTINETAELLRTCSRVVGTLLKIRKAVYEQQRARRTELPGFRP